VKYSKKYLDVRGGGKKSKAQRILEFLERYRNGAEFIGILCENTLYTTGAAIGIL